MSLPVGRKKWVIGNIPSFKCVMTVTIQPFTRWLYKQREKAHSFIDSILRSITGNANCSYCFAFLGFVHRCDLGWSRPRATIEHSLGYQRWVCYDSDVLLSICSSGTDEVEQISRREDCDCVTSGGRCMHTGDYQCHFSDGPSIVQCNLAGKWTLVSKCDDTCKTLHNDRPYCL